MFFLPAVTVKFKILRHTITAKTLIKMRLRRSVEFKSRHKCAGVMRQLFLSIYSLWISGFMAKIVQSGNVARSLLSAHITSAEKR